MSGVKMIAASAVFGLCALPASAADLRAEDAAHHVGETATVCGVVASAKFDAGLQSQPTFLDFGKPYPDQVFTAVIFGDDRVAARQTSLRVWKNSTETRLARNRYQRSETADAVKHRPSRASCRTPSPSPRA
jgi:hypothetical protein